MYYPYFWKNEIERMQDTGLLALFQKIKAGDTAAFNALYHQTWRELFDLAFAKTKDEDEAKDIVQDIYIKLWEKRGRLDIWENVAGYLRRATKREVIRRLQVALQTTQRQTLYKEAIESIAIAVDDLLLAKELHTQWESEIAKLPQKQREIYSRYYLFAYSITEIASELGIAEQTVKNQLVSANKKIRVVMDASLFIWLLAAPSL